jgi:hypothetical protein
MGNAIERTIEQALKLGVLTPAAQRDVELLCQEAQHLSVEQQVALERLMRGLQAGAVVAVPPQELRNVLEELVLSEAIAQIASLGNPAPAQIDLHRVAATALNHLPPLYACTQTPEVLLREWAIAQLEAAIRHQVSDALGQQLRQEDPDDVHQLLNSETWAMNFARFVTPADSVVGTFSSDQTSTSS